MAHAQNGVAVPDIDATPTRPAPGLIRSKVRDYLVENFLLGEQDGIGDDASLMEAGVLDSTGALEIVAFLEAEFGIAVRDHEIVADNLDSIARIEGFVGRKLATGGRRG